MSLINTRLQNVREKSNIDSNEYRPSRYGGLNLFKTQTDAANGIITPALKAKAETSIGNTLQTPVIDFDAGVTISNTRSVTIADDENTSQMVNINFATYSWGFTMVPASYMNQEIDMQADFEVKFLKYLYKFAKTLDSVAISALNGAKTKVFEDALGYTVTGDTIQVPYDEREDIIGNITPIMSANDHFGDIHLVGNGGVESLIKKLEQKGVYNSENKQLEYSDKILHFSTRLANGVGEFANMFAVQGGSVGMLTRFERECILNTEMADGTAWGIDNLPLIDMPVGTYFYESKGDQSGTAGAATADLTRGRKQHFGFSVDVAFLTSYISDDATIASPIVKATIAAKP